MELGPCTADMLHLFANMDITTMRRMPAPLMVSTGLIGSREAYLSAQDPGSTEAAGIGAAAGVMVAVAVTMVAADTDAAMVMDSAAGTAAVHTAAGTFAVVTAAGSEVAMAVVSAAALEEDFTAAVDPMARRLEVMAAVEVMAADTGN